MAIKWEYQVLVDPSTEQLNSSGIDGWELVGLSSYKTGGGFALNGIGGASYTVHTQYVLKRRVNSVNKDVYYSKDRNIETPDYQLYLCNKYDVEKNELLGKYVLGDNFFDSLQDALLHAHARDESDQTVAAFKEQLAKKATPRRKGKVGTERYCFTEFMDNHVEVDCGGSMKHYESLGKAISELGPVKGKIGPQKLDFSVSENEQVTVDLGFHKLTYSSIDVAIERHGEVYDA